MELSETLEGKLKPLGYFPLMHSRALPWCFVHPGFFLLLSLTGAYVSRCHPTWGTPNTLAEAWRGPQLSTAMAGLSVEVVQSAGQGLPQRSQRRR